MQTIPRRDGNLLLALTVLLMLTTWPFFGRSVSLARRRTLDRSLAALVEHTPSDDRPTDGTGPRS